MCGALARSRRCGTAEAAAGVGGSRWRVPPWPTWCVQVKRRPAAPSQLSRLTDRAANVLVSDSVDVRLADGRGRCAGRLEVKYEGSWQRVREEGWTDANSNAVCRQLACGGGGSGQGQFPQGAAAFLPRAVRCAPTAGRLAECTSGHWEPPPESHRAVMLACEGQCPLPVSGSVPQTCLPHAGTAFAPNRSRLL